VTDGLSTTANVCSIVWGAALLIGIVYKGVKYWRKLAADYKRDEQEFYDWIANATNTSTARSDLAAYVTTVLLSRYFSTYFVLIWAPTFVMVV